MPEYTLLSTEMRLLCPAVRTPGIHLSDVIHDLAVRQRMYLAEDEDGPGQTEAMELGLSVERARIERLAEDDPGEWLRMGSFAIDGIEISPDLVRAATRRPREVKGTWMSVARGPGDVKLWRFEVQLGGYCYGLGKLYGEKVLAGELDVTYFRGAYTEEKLAARRLWELIWTPPELLHNWVMIQTQAEWMERNGWKPGARLVEEGPGQWVYVHRNREEEKAI
jgi:hypothetical protein